MLAGQVYNLAPFVCLMERTTLRSSNKFQNCHSKLGNILTTHYCSAGILQIDVDSYMCTSFSKLGMKNLRFQLPTLNWFGMAAFQRSWRKTMNESVKGEAVIAILNT